MAGKTYPVGSVVKMNDWMGIVAGITTDETENRLVKSYILVPYPIGFTGTEYLRLVPAEETELISEGYRSQAAEPYLTYMDLIDEASEKADAQTIKKYMEESYRTVFGGDY